MKVCSKCGVSDAGRSFRASNKGAGGTVSICRICENRQQRIRRARPKHQAWAKAYRATEAVKAAARAKSKAAYHKDPHAKEKCRQMAIYARALPSDSYVRGLLQEMFAAKIEFPPEAIAAKRAILKVKRLIKETAQ